MYSACEALADACAAGPQMCVLRAPTTPDSAVLPEKEAFFTSIQHPALVPCEISGLMG